MIPPCRSGKLAYETRREAQKAFAAFKQRRGADELHAYHCQQCGAWHLGRGRPIDARKKSIERRLSRLGSDGAR
jgi:hypothetical protein